MKDGKKKERFWLSPIKPKHVVLSLDTGIRIFNSFGGGIITDAEQAGMHNCIVTTRPWHPKMQYVSALQRQQTAGSKIISLISH